MLSFSFYGIVLSEHIRKIVTQLRCEEHASMSSLAPRLCLSGSAVIYGTRLENFLNPFMTSHPLLYRSVSSLLLHNKPSQNLAALTPTGVYFVHASAV